MGDNLISSRDLSKAREAYDAQDAGASRVAHTFNATARKEPHQGTAGEYIQSVVFGGLDGIITTFAVVAAAAGSKLSQGTIFIIGFANLIADAIGMGIGDFLSSKAENDHAHSERKREKWEIDNVPEIEQKEMIDIYMAKGLPEEDAKRVVALLFESKEAFLDIMMIEELGMMPSEATSSPWKSALITFTSFIILGGLPMLPYLASGKYNERASTNAVFWSSVALFVVCLYILGAIKGKITGKRWWLTGLTMLINGGITTTIAYLIGFSLGHLIHI